MQPLPYYDHELLDTEDARSLRILTEYLEPLVRFGAQNIQDTVILFGSVRILSREDATVALKRAVPGIGRPGYEEEWRRNSVQQVGSAQAVECVFIGAPS